jgi:hypothetical protein
MRRTLVALAGGILLGACGGSPPPKEPEAPPPAPPPAHAAAPMQATQELGSIDEDATNKTFQSLQDKLLNCQKDGMTRVEFLAGDAKFFLRIAQDGSIHWAFLEDSTLGDRDTEKCMLQVVSSTHWPQPEGGEAEVQKSISFDGGDARPPVSWQSDKVASVLAAEGDDALKCKAGTRGVYKVTAYVEPGGAASAEGAGTGKGKKHKGHAAAVHGKVVAVGVAPPNREGESKADCIADAVKDWKMPSPGGYAAKVTFSL